MANAQSFLRLIKNEEHYSEVMSRMMQVHKTLWIGTADIKDLYIRVGISAEPFLGVLATLIRQGVEVRLIHAKEPGPIFREEFDHFPILAKQLERVLCPRVHFKLIVFDMNTVYIGSANLTGAAMGMKSPQRRNFECGILTNIPTMVDETTELFDYVWMGAGCSQCGRKQYCGDKIK